VLGAIGSNTIFDSSEAPYDHLVRALKTLHPSPQRLQSLTQRLLCPLFFCNTASFILRYRHFFS